MLCPASLRVAFLDYELRPLLIGNAQSDPHPRGKAVDWVKSAVLRTDCNPKLELLRLPVARGRLQLAHGSIDVWSVAIASKELVETAVFPSHTVQVSGALGYFDSAYFFYVLKEQSAITWNGAALQAPPGTTIGVARIPALQELVRAQNLKEELGATTQSVLSKLLKGRSPVAILPEILMNSQPQDVLDRMRRLDPALLRLQYYAPVSKSFQAKYPEFVDKFWRELCVVGRADQKSKSVCR